MTYFEPEFDENGFELPLPAEACISHPSQTGKFDDACSGPVHTRYSRSGMTSTYRCDSHEMRHQDALDEISNRYPDSSVAPDWFDPTYAGETWDDDY